MHDRVDLGGNCNWLVFERPQTDICCQLDTDGSECPEHEAEICAWLPMFYLVDPKSAHADLAGERGLIKPERSATCPNDRADVPRGA
jgi:hypothetical protein